MVELEFFKEKKLGLAVCPSPGSFTFENATFSPVNVLSSTLLTNEVLFDKISD